MSEEVEVTEGEETPVIKDPKAVLSALDRAKSDAQKYREDADALRAQLAEKTEDKYKTRAINAEVKLVLQEKGIKDQKNVNRIMKYLDTSDLDFDDDGNLPGLEGKISSLKEEFSEFFSRKYQTQPVEQFVEGSKAKPLTASEIQAKQIMGR